MSVVEQVVIAILNRGNVVYEWPDDEAAAYRDAGGFSEGMAAVNHIRFEKIAALFSPNPCSHPVDKREMRGWTQVCTECGKGREIG